VHTPGATTGRSSGSRASNRQLTFMQVEGARIRVSVRGKGPPLLLIMGLGGSLEMWAPLEEALNASGLQTIAYDASGTGRSPARLIPQSMSALARQAARLLDALGHRRADVLGISFGGAVAQELAISHPRRVRRLVLTSTSCGLGGVPGNLLALSDLGVPLRSYSPTYLRMASDVVYGRAPGAGGRGTAREGRPHGQPPTLWGYMGQLAAAVGWTSLPRLTRIQCPTLVLAGEDDVIVPPVNSRILAARIKGARLEVFPGAGHLLLMNQPQRCAGTIAPFLGHPGPGARRPG
jgi:pimeloyl-ACP methyl ester carboxylesterase